MDDVKHNEVRVYDFLMEEKTGHVGRGSRRIVFRAAPSFVGHELTEFREARGALAAVGVRAHRVSINKSSSSLSSGVCIYLALEISFVSRLGASVNRVRLSLDCGSLSRSLYPEISVNIYLAVGQRGMEYIIREIANECQRTVACNSRVHDSDLIVPNSLKTSATRSTKCVGVSRRFAFVDTPRVAVFAQR